MTMLRETKLSTPSGKLNLARGPESGPPLLLLHGVTRCWQDWSMLLAPLAVRWHIRALDFHGHGRSDRTPGEYRVVDYIEDAKVLVKSCVQSPVIFGHSLGAMVALAVAAEMEVRAVILEDPPFETMGKRMAQSSFQSLFDGMQQVLQEASTEAGITRALEDIQISSPESFDSTRLGELRDDTSLRFSGRCLSQLDPDVLAPIVAGEWLIGYDLDVMLGKVHCPVLLLQADIAASGMLTDEDANKMSSSLPDLCHIRFPGAGHLLHWMETEKVLRAAMGFLESV